MIAVIAVLDAGGIGLPFLAWWNLRAPERRREFWLRANARPRLTIAMYSILAAAVIIWGVVMCVLSVVVGSIWWAPIPLTAGLLATMIIWTVFSLRTPPDSEGGG
jgi:hypothetical protein